MTESSIILHGALVSGHTHRVELLLRALNLPYTFREASAALRATPEFRRLNPLGQIPVLEDGSFVLPDSNAILVYLARRYGADTAWLPVEPLELAAVQRWLSIAAGEMAYGPATARMVTLWNVKADIQRAQAIAARLLPFMDAHLADRTWLATDHPTIADLACYGYLARASEGRISLSPYPSIGAWLRRIEAMPFFKPMPETAIPENAP
jgi:glutathione S-transferase